MVEAIKGPFSLSVFCQHVPFLRKQSCAQDAELGNELVPPSCSLARCCVATISLYSCFAMGQWGEIVSNQHVNRRARARHILLRK